MASRAAEWGLIEELDSTGVICRTEDACECRLTVLPLDASFVSLTIPGNYGSHRVAEMEKCLDLAYRRGYQTAQRNIRFAMGVQEPSR